MPPQSLSWPHSQRVALSSSAPHSRQKALQLCRVPFGDGGPSRLHGAGEGAVIHTERLRNLQGRDREGRGENGLG